ncbi:MAG: ShlB/FhaC/HecB family hemolysin secretion/activation protein, partial [Microcoleaceae cyanobacterium]
GLPPRPGTPIDPMPPGPSPIPQPPPEPPLQVPPDIEPEPPEPEPEIPDTETPDTINVTQFQFEGNTAFTDEELAAVVEESIGELPQEITFAELLQAESAITKFYVDEGYVNSGAILPAGQNLSEGTVTFEIIEGGLEEIVVTGTGRLNPGYVRGRIELATEAPLNVNDLLTALQLLQLDPLIENISAELSAGSRPELSVLTVTVSRAGSFGVQLFIDNGRTPSVGSFRRGVSVTEANLFGLGDKLNVAYANTDGSHRYDVNYTIPINVKNGTIRFDYFGTNSDVIEEPFDELDIEGDSDRYSLTYRQPINQTPTQDIALGLTLSRDNSETQILGEREPLSAGADNQGRTRVSALRFFQEYTRRTSRSVLAGRSQFSLGVGAFGATVNDEPPDSRFFSWRGQGQYVQLLAPETLLVFRGDVQLSTRALVPLEQFALGGYQSVRGYRQDFLLTDNGVFLSAEALIPIVRIGDDGVIQVVPFFDFGTGWNTDRPDPQDATLLGTGLGLQVRFGDTFTGRIEYGIPLIDVETRDEDTLQEEGVYFSVIYNVF